MNEQEKIIIERVERRRRFIINVVYWGIIAAFLYVGVQVTEPVLLPIIVAFVIAWLLHRPIDWLADKIHIKKSVVALCVVIMVYFIIGLVLVRLSMGAFVLLQNFFIDIPDFYNNEVAPLLTEFFVWFENIWKNIDPMLLEGIEKSADDILNSLGGLVTNISSNAIAWISGKALSIPGIVMKIFITLIVTVFVTMDFHTIISFIARQIPEKNKKYFKEIRDYTGGTLLKCLKSYILIMLLTFSELIIGFTIIGIQNAPVLAAIIAVIDILPVLGTGGVLIPWTIISIITGDIKLGISIAVLYIIILVVRNIVEPKIVGSQVGLHPVITLASMFTGLHFFGILGMFGFPIGLSVIKNLNDRGVISIFK